MDKHMFISYTRTDGEFALRLAKDLRLKGVNIWLDQINIPAGEKWDRSIEKALKTCERVICLLSPASVSSDNVMDEVGFALDNKIPLIPVLLKACDIPLRIKRLQYIDFSSDYGQGLERLSGALVSKSQEPPKPLTDQDSRKEDGASSWGTLKSTSTMGKWLRRGGFIVTLGIASAIGYWGYVSAPPSPVIPTLAPAGISVDSIRDDLYADDRRKNRQKFVDIYEKDPAVLPLLLDSLLDKSDSRSYRVNLGVAWVLANVPGGWVASDTDKQRLLGYGAISTETTYQDTFENAIKNAKPR